MCEEILRGAIGIVGTILGAISGFLLSEWGTKRREDREEEKITKSVRVIVSLEIDRNLKTLKELWQTANQCEESEQDGEVRKRDLASRFAKIPFPDFSRKALDSQLSSLSIALRDQEITKVFQFYDRLDRLETIRFQLMDRKQEQTQQFLDETKPAPASYRAAKLGYRPPQMFNQMADEYWNECESLVAQLFAKGNPLKNMVRKE